MYAEKKGSIYNDGGNTCTPLSSDDESEDIEAPQDNAFSCIPTPTSAHKAPSTSLANDGVVNTVCCV